DKEQAFVLGPRGECRHQTRQGHKPAAYLLALVRKIDCRDCRKNEERDRNVSVLNCAVANKERRAQQKQPADQRLVRPAKNPDARHEKADRRTRKDKRKHRRPYQRVASAVAPHPADACRYEWRIVVVSSLDHLERLSPTRAGFEYEPRAHVPHRPRIPAS